MLVASTAPLRSTMSARCVWIGAPGIPARGSTGTDADTSAIRPATVEKPRINTTPSSRSRVSAFTRSA